jgi:hypothetical protein
MPSTVNNAKDKSEHVIDIILLRHPARYFQSVWVRQRMDVADGDDECASSVEFAICYRNYD